MLGRMQDMQLQICARLEESERSRGLEDLFRRHITSS
jgi:hypothetical protein